MTKLLRRFRFEILASLFVLLLIVLFTWPVVLNPFRIIFGYSGDNFGNIWFFWWQNYARQHGLDAASTPFYNAPEGYRMNLNLSESAWMVPFGLISRFLSPIFTFNLFVFASFFLSFWTMGGLAFYITRNRWASFWAGLLYSFSPFHFWQGLSHASLSYIQYLPLFVWSLFYFDRQKSLKSAVFLSLSFTLVSLTSFYYAFFSILVATVFLGWRAIFDFRNYLKLKVLGLGVFSALVVGVLLSPTIKVLWLSKSDSDSSANQTVSKAFKRQLDELVGLSARPWDFLIYPPNHPFFGKFNKPIYDFIQSQGSDFKVRSAYLPERVVFLGILNFVLALLGFLLILTRRRDLLVVGVCLLAVWVTSLPPYFLIKGTAFYTPSYFFYQILPIFRVYTRLGVYVLLFATLLSSLFLNYLFDRLRKVLPTFLLFTFYFLLLTFSLFEFWPTMAVTDLRNLPPVYDWLSRQPGDPLVAEYPKDFDLPSGLIFQTFHQKKLFNMPGESPRSKIWDTVGNLEDGRAFVTLKREGVKYVIYHLVDLTPNPYDDWRFFRAAKAPTAEKLGAIKEAGFRLVESFPEALVLEID